MYYVTRYMTSNTSTVRRGHWSASVRALHVRARTLCQTTLRNLVIECARTQRQNLTRSCISQRNVVFLSAYIPHTMQHLLKRNFDFYDWHASYPLRATLKCSFPYGVWRRKSKHSATTDVLWLCVSLSLKCTAYYHDLQTHRCTASLHSRLGQCMCCSQCRMGYATTEKGSECIFSLIGSQTLYKHTPTHIDCALSKRFPFLLIWQVVWCL